ncbi:TetR/AcrR family transcriptional regulator [Compostimonas suwonensis]|uniref:AcrR family transcriptional regulator n=1 Tax=Compostimonas suwonensis TaxID=1048394 RepID=A0A2M9BBV3_9MICO|nr:TetR family transcriptional regulator [Compostimonas suwonensis]PJJ55429.1 AcrR family transcriptional regulator [Compostimonas suwonensis]
MSTSVEPGLRERKRIATRRTIQRSVLLLAVEHGFDRVTVEDISRESQISPRTFFNYFSSKDEALVGDIPELPDEPIVEQFVTAGPDGDILDQLGELFAASATSAAEDREMHTLRRQVFQRHPHLFGLKMQTMRAFEATLYELVVRRLLRDDPSLETDEAALYERAWLITLVAFAGLRHGWRCWAEMDNPGSLSERLRASFRQLHTIASETR